MNSLSCKMGMPTRAHMPDLRNAQLRMSVAEVIYLHRKKAQATNKVTSELTNPRRLRVGVNGPVPVPLESLSEQIRTDQLEACQLDSPRIAM